MSQSSESGESNDMSGLLAGVPVSEKKGGALGTSQWAAIGVAAVVVLIIIIIIYMQMQTGAGSVSISGFHGHGGSSSHRAALTAPAAATARKLAGCGWVLYVRDNCGYCTKQLTNLKGGYPNAVHYGGDGTLISSTVPSPMSYSQVGGFPTWHNTKTGETKPGLKSPAELIQMASQCM